MATKKDKVAELDAALTVAENDYRTASEAKKDAANRCTELGIALLRAGYPRSGLIGRPYSAAYVTQLQIRAGTTARQKKETGK